MDVAVPVGPVGSAQLPLEDLARRVPREIFDDHEMLRDFLFGDALGDEVGMNLSYVDRLSLPKANKGSDPLPVYFVRPPQGGSFF